jgi:hypothetical protein
MHVVAVFELLQQASYGVYDAKRITYIYRKWAGIYFHNSCFNNSRPNFKRFSDMKNSVSCFLFTKIISF